MFHLHFLRPRSFQVKLNFKHFDSVNSRIKKSIFKYEQHLLRIKTYKHQVKVKTFWFPITWVSFLQFLSKPTYKVTVSDSWSKEIFSTWNFFFSQMHSFHSFHSNERLKIFEIFSIPKKAKMFLPMQFIKRPFLTR